MRLVFDGFEIDPQGCQLWRGGAEVALEPRALDLLCYLATRPGQLVRKEDLLAEVWDAKTLSDGVLSNTIGKLRRALGQDSHENTPIETVHGRGYRWRALAQAPPLPAAEPAPPRERATDFVGRRAVLDEFVKALERATGLTLIVGETGIGKTRALAELARLARARGYTVWCGSAYDGAGAPAYWPWIEILRAAHAELSELAWERHLPRDPRGLGLIVPEFVSATRSAGADEQAERFRIFDEVSRFLAAVSGEAPRLIVLDDMHWADATSLELLAFAARALEQAKRPVLFAAGLRDRDVSLSPAQRATIQRLERLGTRVALAGLELDEVSELVLRQSRDSLERGLARSRRQPADAEREQLGAAADGGEVSAPAESAVRVHQALQRRTQGNPFFILQILGWLAQRSLPADLTNIASSALPAAVEGVIRQRIALLAEPARAALSAAAAIGHEFDAALLARVLERGVEETLRAIEPARQLGVIERSCGGPQQFAFTHALLREVLYEDLAWAEAGLLHAKLADALAGSIARDDVRRLGELARHALLAVPCELTRAVQACRLAADAARESAGFEVAAALLARALQKLDAEAGDDATRCDLLLTLGFDQLCSGDVRGALQTLERGAAVADEMGDAQRLASFACRMADWSDYGAATEEQTRTRLELSLARLPLDDCETRAMLLARLAKHDEQRPDAERQALLDEAEQLARRSAAPAVSIDVAFCRASVRDPTRAAANRVATARYRALIEQHPALCSSMRDRLRRVSAEVTDYFAALTLAELDAADAALARWCAAAQRFQVPALSLVAELARAGRALAAGQLDELAAMLQRSGDSVVDSSHSSVWSLYALLYAEARGELAAYANLELPELPRATQQFSARLHVLRDVWAAWLYARTGRSGLARDSLQQLTAASIAGMPVHYGDLGLLCMLAEVHGELADPEAARQLYRQLAPHAALNAVGMAADCKGSVAHYVGLLASTFGDVREAVRQLERAEAMNAHLQMPLQLARTRALLAECRTRAQRADLA